MQQLPLDNSIINHLLFHKSIAGIEEDNSEINHYIELATNTSSNISLLDQDLFDRSIHLTFDLVLNNNLDPWNLDLTAFSHLYLHHAEEQQIDLITAGKIIHLAWRILKLQSDHLVNTIESTEEEEDTHFGWDDLPLETWDDYSTTSYMDQLILEDEIPLSHPQRREGRRKITLIELLNAFEDARKEAKRFQLIDNLRKKDQDNLLVRAHKRMTGAAHEDHIEEDIATTWLQIHQHPTTTMTLEDLMDDKDDEERLRLFISVLFLAIDKRVSITQRRFPFGRIIIKRLVT